LVFNARSYLPASAAAAVEQQSARGHAAVARGLQAMQSATSAVPLHENAQSLMEDVKPAAPAAAAAPAALGTRWRLSKKWTREKRAADAAAAQAVVQAAKLPAAAVLRQQQARELFDTVVSAASHSASAEGVDWNLGASARPGARREEPPRSLDGALRSGAVGRATPLARGGVHTQSGKPHALQQTNLDKFLNRVPATAPAPRSAASPRADSPTDGGIERRGTWEDKEMQAAQEAAADQQAAAVRDHVDGSVAAAAHSDHESDVGNAADDKVPLLAARQEGTEPR
jgi:hypothetical protein